MVGLEEESNSQSSVCHDVTPLLNAFGPMVIKVLRFLMESAPAIKLLIRRVLYHFGS